MNVIKISIDFSNTPGGRYKSEGNFSGEEFRDKLLYPQILKASRDNKLTIDFDGCYGFGTGFLEEAFGGLVRKYHLYDIFDKLELISNEDKTLIELVNKYIEDAIGE